MKQILSDETQTALRTEKIISESEVAMQIGDKFIAENILSRTRREINVPVRLLENSGNRRVLKG